MSRLWQILTYPFRRQRGPLAARRPGREEMGQTADVPLGMEATDLSLVDKVTRRNDALERTHVISTQRTGSGQPFFRAASTRIEPMPEDETYAARYHRAYIRKED